MELFTGDYVTVAMHKYRIIEYLLRSRIVLIKSLTRDKIFTIFFSIV